MVGGKACGTLQEILVSDLLTVFAVEVVPCSVNAVPFSVIHLDIVPHMTDLSSFIEVAENADAGDIQAVADELEAF